MPIEFSEQNGGKIFVVHVSGKLVDADFYATRDHDSRVERRREIAEPMDQAPSGSMRLEPIYNQENIMQVQVNTNHNIEGHEALATQVSDVIESALVRVGDRITQVEVHLSDENGDKQGQNDKRCMMEARLEGRQPVAVTHQAGTLDQAVNGAADKLTRLIESTLGRGRHQERRTDPPLHGQKYAD